MERHRPFFWRVLLSVWNVYVAWCPECVCYHIIIHLKPILFENIRWKIEIDFKNVLNWVSIYFVSASISPNSIIVKT